MKEDFFVQGHQRPKNWKQLKKLVSVDFGSYFGTRPRMTAPPPPRTQLLTQLESEGWPESRSETDNLGKILFVLTEANKLKFFICSFSISA